MADIWRKTRPSQPFGHLLRGADRPVPSTRAAESHGYIALAGCPVAGNPIDEKRFDAAQRLAPGRLLFQIGTDRGVHAGQRTEIVFPVRIGKEAHVEDKVGGSRNASRECEGGERQDGLIALGPITVPQFLTQNCRREFRGVDQRIGRRAK